MKSEKGITMVSLTIYIALIFIVIAMLATITASVKNNVENTNNDGEKMAEVNKFNMYFVQEIKDEENYVVEVISNRISFSNGKEFYYDSVDKSIKLIDGEKTIEISQNIENCTFSFKLENGKNIVSVTIKPQDVAQIQNDYVVNTRTEKNKIEDEKDYTKQNVATE